jgi:hypothetical protein
VLLNRHTNRTQSVKPSVFFPKKAIAPNAQSRHGSLSSGTGIKSDIAVVGPAAIELAIQRVKCEPVQSSIKIQSAATGLGALASGLRIR